VNRVTVATIPGRMPVSPPPSSAVERFAEILLASDLPGLTDDHLRRTAEFIERRVEVLPSITRFGVRVIGGTVDLLGRSIGQHRVLTAVTALPLPLLAEYPRLIRSLGFAYIWETWPDTAVDGAPS
jgi:hypothetical protein